MIQPVASDRRPTDEASAGPTVASVAGDRRLGLTVLTASGGLDRPVLAAHTSELLDPTPWLQGGELLMTTGLSLGADPAALTAYVSRLAAAGVACLAVGTGGTLTHSEVPLPMVETAAAVGLPLLEVAERTPFLAVTQAVFAQIGAAHYAEQVRALDAQRTLTAAAVHPGGVQAVAAALAQLTQTSVLVTDVAGRPLAAVPENASALQAQLLPQLERLRAHGLRASSSAQEPGRDVRVQALGSQRLRGFLVRASTGPPGAFERQLLAVGVGLLTLELERLQGRRDAFDLRRTDVARTLLATSLPDAVAADLLRSVGLLPAELRAVVLLPPAEHGGDRTTALTSAVERLAERLPGLLVVSEGHESVVLVPDPPDDVTAVVAQAVGGLAAGLGTARRPGDAAVSARQGRSAAREAVRRGGGVVDVTALGSVRLLLALDTSGAVADFGDAVLGPVDRAGRRGDALLSSLRAFLESNGAWDEAAALLGVHRHTLRQRLRRVEELTGRRLDSGSDRMELLLAFQARDLHQPS